MSNKYYKENAWWVSLYNEKAEVVNASVPKHKVEIHDSTLRDGEQTPGVVFSIDDKLRIAEKLIEAGVTRIEAGMPAVSHSDYTAIKKIRSTFKEADVYAFVRATRADVDMACECGVKGVIIEVPIGYPKLKYQFGWTWENVLERSVDCINHARSLGLKAVYFPYDTTRARESDLENLVSNIMKYSPPDSIGVVDTMGCALPETIAYLVRKIKKMTNGLSVEVHTHNDFGLAIATEMAGIVAGADVAHTCVNGLGERTGNAALEELILAMNILLGLETPYKLDKLKELCELVESISGIPIAPNKPFSGRRNYTRESGIGVNLVVEEPLAMFATDPNYFGKTGEIVLGKKSGKASIQYFIDKMNIKVSDEQITEILNDVKTLGTEKKRLVTEEEFKDILKRYV